MSEQQDLYSLDDDLEVLEARKAARLRRVAEAKRKGVPFVPANEYDRKHAADMEYRRKQDAKVTDPRYQKFSDRYDTLEDTAIRMARMRREQRLMLEALKRQKK